jgi:hypothetical protein
MFVGHTKEMEIRVDLIKVRKIIVRRNKIKTSGMMIVNVILKTKTNNLKNRSILTTHKKVIRVKKVRKAIRVIRVRRVRRVRRVKANRKNKKEINPKTTRKNNK